MACVQSCDTHWEPLVLGPALAMLKMPGLEWVTACAQFSISSRTLVMYTQDM